MNLDQVFRSERIPPLGGGRFKRFLKWVLFSWIGLITFSLHTYILAPGLDSSWMFALNYFAEKGMKFGKDLAWTYGPLGFLMVPLKVGSNLEIGVTFQSLVWVIFVAVLFHLVYKNRFSNLQLFCFFLFLSGGSWAWAWPRRWDYFACFVILFFLCLAKEADKKWYLFYLAAASLSTVLIFIKLSSALLAMSSMALFTLVAWMFDRNKFFLSAAISFIGIPVAFILIYLLYNPSPVDLIYYLKYGFEITSGYSGGMSESEENIEILWAILFIFIFLFMALKLYRWKESSFPLSILFALPLFIAFKHGFVRQPPHVTTFFSFSLVIFGLTLLFTSTKRLKDKKFVLLIALIILSWTFVVASHKGAFQRSFLERVAGLSAFKDVKTAANLSERTRKIEGYFADRLSESKLPPAFSKKIGQEKVGLFTWELTYAAANHLNYVPFPIFQTYSAYTSTLDLADASHLEDPEKAPRFILMAWSTMDQRHPLIDGPGMWISLYKWYDLEEGNDSMLLLKRRGGGRFSKLRFINREDHSLLDKVRVPSSQHPIVAKISIDLNLLGRLSKIFFRIPEVYMAGMTDLGGVAFKVMPDVLRDGVLINYIPTNLRETDSFIRRNMVEDRVLNFRIYGEGTKFLSGKMSVEFYEINEVTIHQSREEGLPPIFELPSISLPVKYEVCSINTHSIRKGENEKESIKISEKEGFLVVKGWSIDGETEEKTGGVYIDIDGKSYRASYGGDLREGFIGGIVEYGARPIYKNCCYTGVIPISEIGRGPHRLSIKILAKDKKGWYKAEEKVLFEIE